MIGRRFLPLSVAAAMWTASARAQTHPGVTFDQTIRATRPVTSDDTTPALLHFAVSNGNMRVDIQGRMPGTQRIAPGNRSVMLVTDSGAKLTMLNLEQKQYITINTVEMLEGVTKMMKAMGGTISIDSTGTTAKLDSLGPGPVVDGHPTLRYRITTAMRMSMSMMGESGNFEQQAVEDIQAATDLGDLADVATSLNRLSGVGQSMGLAPGFMERLAAIRLKVRGFPLRVTKVQTVKVNGQTRSTSEDMVTSNVKRVPVPDSLFAIPPGYTPVSGPKPPGTVDQ